MLILANDRAPMYLLILLLDINNNTIIIFGKKTETVSIGKHSAKNLEITFPISFTTKYSITCNPYCTSSISAWTSAILESTKTVSGTTIRFGNSFENTYTMHGCYYLCIGY